MIRIIELRKWKERAVTIKSTHGLTTVPCHVTGFLVSPSAIHGRNWCALLDPGEETKTGGSKMPAVTLASVKMTDLMDPQLGGGAFNQGQFHSPPPGDIQERVWR